MQDASIIRNRQKIAAAIGNARVFLDIQRESGSFSDYIWGFLPDKKPIINTWKDHSTAPARTDLSDRISSDLKRSEEHTSELQSLMRISYAVFCLQKKTIKYNHKNTQYRHITKFIKNSSELYYIITRS